MDLLARAANAYSQSSSDAGASASAARNLQVRLSSPSIVDHVSSPPLINVSSPPVVDHVSSCPISFNPTQVDANGAAAWTGQAVTSFPNGPNPNVGTGPTPQSVTVAVTAVAAQAC